MIPVTTTTTTTTADDGDDDDEDGKGQGEEQQEEGSVDGRERENEGGRERRSEDRSRKSSTLSVSSYGIPRRLESSPLVRARLIGLLRFALVGALASWQDVILAGWQLASCIALSEPTEGAEKLQGKTFAGHRTSTFPGSSLP